MFEVIALILLSQQPLVPVAEGVASYYTVASSGPVTASGERFSDHELTCAMRDGVFGEYYLVVGENGRSVVVKLNDRGPFVDDRVLDLSKAAMKQLDAVDQGLIHVSIYRLGASIPRAPGFN
jgi:rare lipoprotein A